MCTHPLLSKVRILPKRFVKLARGHAIAPRHHSLGPAYEQTLRLIDAIYDLDLEPFTFWQSGWNLCSLVDIL